jgi:hypothetical protein
MFGYLEIGIWILFDICYLVIGNFLKEGLNRTQINDNAVTVLISE